MSTLVAVLRADGAVQFANAALENTLGLSRRTLEGVDFSTFFTDPALLQTALACLGDGNQALGIEIDEHGPRAKDVTDAGEFRIRHVPVRGRGDDHDVNEGFVRTERGHGHLLAVARVTTLGGEATR